MSEYGEKSWEDVVEALRILAERNGELEDEAATLRARVAELEASRVVIVPSPEPPLTPTCSKEALRGVPLLRSPIVKASREQMKALYDEEDAPAPAGTVRISAQDLEASRGRGALAFYSLADVKGDPVEHGQSSAVAKTTGIAPRKREIVIYCQGEED